MKNEDEDVIVPQFRDMCLGFKFIFDGFGLDNPLISVISVFMNKFGCFVTVY